LRQGLMNSVLQTVEQALMGQVRRKQTPPVMTLETRRHVAGSTASLHGVLQAAAFGNRIENAEQNLFHATVPPEIPFAPGNVGELSRIHHAVSDTFGFTCRSGAVTSPLQAAVLVFQYYSRCTQVVWRTPGTACYISKRFPRPSKPCGSSR